LKNSALPGLLTSTQIAQKYHTSTSSVQKFAKAHNVPYIRSGLRITYLFNEEYEALFKNRDQRKGRRWNTKVCIIQHPPKGSPRFFCFYHIKYAFLYTLDNGAYIRIYHTQGQKFSGNRGFFNRADKDQQIAMKKIMNAPGFSGKLCVWAASTGEKKYFFDNKHIDRMFCVRLFFSLHQCREATVLQQAVKEFDDAFIIRLYEANKGIAAMSLKSIEKNMPHDYSA
jgi:hypothetical protein